MLINLARNPSIFRFVRERANESYLNMHLIPADPALWKLERFEDFIIERKKLISEKFGFLLVSPVRLNPDSDVSDSEFDSEGRKSIARLIDAGLIAEGSRLVLKYRNQEFNGIARRDGIELPDRVVRSPSAAAIRCYSSAGSRRPTENGWIVWKNTEGRSLNDLFEQLRPSPTVEDLLGLL